MNEKVGLWEIFETDEQTEIVMWHLLNMLGGKIVIPEDSNFWDMAIAPGVQHRVVLCKEDGKLVLKAQKLEWN